MTQESFEIKCLRCGYSGSAKEFYVEHHEEDCIIVKLRCPRCGNELELAEFEELDTFEFA